MTKELPKNFLGQRLATCEFYKCKRKSFRAYAGIVCCREHYRHEMISMYGSVKKAGKYCDIKGIKP